MSFEYLQLIYGFFGSLSFALLFNSHLKRIFPASFGGLISWGVYLLAMHFELGLFFSSVLASACAALYSELLARIFKAPTTVFLIPSLIPMIPGRSLFYTMQYAVLNDFALCRSFALEMLIYIGGISLGVSIISALFVIFRKEK